VFGVEVGFQWVKDFYTISKIVSDGSAVMLTLPGHFVAVIAYDSSTDELIYHDSNKAAHQRMNRELYNTCGPYALIFGGRLDA
jgi:hypothetical protein